MFRHLHQALRLDKLGKFSGALGLRHVDVPNLRGRKVPQDHKREQERSGSNCDAESDDEFDFGSTEEVEDGSAEEFVSGHGGSNKKKEPMLAEHGGDEGNKGEKAKIEDELETANSDKSGDNRFGSDV